MSVGLVVDTSVWIDFFGGKTIPLLEDALAIGTVVLPPVVVAELVRGARRPSDHDALLDLMADLEIHETPREHWVRVGELRRHLIEKGIAISTPDAHVAQCALDRDAPLLTTDRAFLRIVRHVPLRLVESP